MTALRYGIELRSERGGGFEFGGGFGGAGAADEDQENSSENQQSGDQEHGDAEVEPCLGAVAGGAGVGEALSAALGEGGIRGDKGRD